MAYGAALCAVIDPSTSTGPYRRHLRASADEYADNYTDASRLRLGCIHAMLVSMINPES